MLVEMSVDDDDDDNNLLSTLVVDIPMLTE
jgi:hypothetical protein